MRNGDVFKTSFRKLIKHSTVSVMPVGLDNDVFACVIAIIRIACNSALQPNLDALSVTKYGNYDNHFLVFETAQT